MIKISTENLEKIMVGLICSALAFTFIFKSDKPEVIAEPVVGEAFEEYPLIAWKIHKKNGMENGVTL